MAWLPGKVRFFEKTTAPTVNDDENDGFRVSDVWLDLTADVSYRCLDASAGVAVWQQSADVDHNSLSGIQGGTTDEYYHLLAAEYTELTEWLDDVTLGADGLTSVPEVVLTPRASALFDAVGGVYFSNIDTSVYVCTEI